MRKTLLPSLLAFCIAMFLISCGGNSGSNTNSNADGDGGGAKQQTDCGDIDDYIASTDKYLNALSGGSIDMDEAMEMYNKAEAIGNEIESKGEGAFSEECWNRFNKAMIKLSEKSEKIAKDQMKDVENMMKEAEDQMKDMENMMQDAN